jgi:hypothetical protein
VQEEAGASAQAHQSSGHSMGYFYSDTMVPQRTCCARIPVWVSVCVSISGWGEASSRVASSVLRPSRACGQLCFRLETGHSDSSAFAMEDGPISKTRYDRVLLVLTPALTIAQLALYKFLLAYWRPQLSKEAISIWAGKGATAMTRSAWVKFHRETSALVFSCLFHMWFGTYGLVSAFAYTDGAPYRILGDVGSLMASGDVEFLRLQETASFLGSVFGALMLQYSFFWVIGWDRDVTNIVHHIVFFAVTIVLAREGAMGHSGLVAMAMEASSPALNAMNIARQLQGPFAESLTLVLFVLFFLAFIVLRGVLFGRAALQVLYLRLFLPDGFPMHVDGWKVDLVVLLWLAGWLLQLHWLRLIAKKLYRKLSRGQKAD